MQANEAKVIKKDPDIPGRIIINGEPWCATTFLVHTKDGKVPALCKLLQEGKEVDLQGGEEFMVAYVRSRVLGIKP